MRYQMMEALGSLVREVYLHVSRMFPKIIEDLLGRSSQNVVDFVDLIQFILARK